MRLRAALLTALILVLCFVALSAQTVSDYTLTRTTNGSLTNMDSGTTQIFNAASNVSDQCSPVFNIGFTFAYCGTNYNQFSLSTNGQIRLGSTAMTQSKANPAAGVAYLVPFQPTSNQMQKTSTGRIHYKTTGSSPNRVCTIEWRAIMIPAGTFSNNTPSTFQVRLYEGSNKIDFVYGTMFLRDPWNYVYVKIGLSNSNTLGTVTTVLNPHLSSVEYYARYSSWSSNYYEPWGAISGLSSTANGSRVMLTFNPPAAGGIINPLSVTHTTLGCTSNQINWSLNPAGNWVMITASTVGFQAGRPVNGTSYPVGSSVPGGGTVIYRGGASTYTHSDLVPGTAYYYKIWSWNSSNVYSAGLEFLRSTAFVHNPTMTLDTQTPNSVNLSWNLNTYSNPVLILHNTDSSFEPPQNGRIYQPGEMIGTARVLYYGSDTSFIHTDLSPYSLNYYARYSYYAPYYSTRNLHTVTTLRSMPFYEDFESSTGYPGGWSGTMTVGEGRGTNGSTGLWCQLSSSDLGVTVTSDTYGNLPQDALLSFDYRLMDVVGYPDRPYQITGTERIEILASNNKGNNYLQIGVINGSNHIASTQFRRVSVPIPSSLVLPGGHVKARLYTYRGTVDFFVEIDNISIERDPNNPVISLSHEAIDFGEVNLHASSDAREFSITNIGTGQLILDQAPTLQGIDAAHFVLMDANSYPAILSEHQSLSLFVSMQPNSLGAKTASLNFSDNLQRSFYSIPLEGFSTDIYHTGGGGIETVAGGYFYANNLTGNANAAPVFQWQQPATDPMPNAVNLGSFSAGAWGPITLDFPFEFYGNSYHEIYVNTNGTISFGAANLNTENSPIPLPGMPNNLIALFWDDLEYYPAASALHLERGAGSITITYSDFGKAGAAFSSSNAITAQVTLYSNGSIKKQYLRVTGSWTPSIGLENADGSLGVQYHYNGSGGAYRRSLRDQGIVIMYGGDSSTLPVTLSSFTAHVSGQNLVRLAWTAESITNHLGYHVFRSRTDKLEEALQINGSLISQGQANGSQTHYSFEDMELYDSASYYYWLLSLDLDGTHRFYGPVFASFESYEPGTPSIPMPTALHAAYPNPFNPGTHLSYSLSEAAAVRLDIFNSKGQQVRSYSRDHQQSGTYSVYWDGMDASGRPLGSGIYLYRMQSGSYSFTRKMVMTK